MHKLQIGYSTAWNVDNKSIALSQQSDSVTAIPHSIIHTCFFTNWVSLSRLAPILSLDVTLGCGLENNSFLRKCTHSPIQNNCLSIYGHSDREIIIDVTEGC